MELIRAIHFYANSQFYFKQSSLVWVHSLIIKDSSISSYSVYSNRANSVEYKYGFYLPIIKCQKPFCIK